jgi:photosystem II stability/assembly factor-like uncharacterized protein
MRARAAVVGTLAAAGVALAAATPAVAAAPSWRATPLAGWESVGAQVPAHPESAAVTGASLAAAGADATLRVADGGGLTATRRYSGHQYGGGVAFVGSGRLLTGAGCAVERTDDGGRTWARARLPGCGRRASQDGSGSRVLVVGERTVLASYDKRVWRSTDGGNSFTATAVRGGPPDAALTPEVWFRVGWAGSALNPTGRIVERTTDAGRTWRALAIPAVLGRGGTRVPADVHGYTVAVRADGVLLLGAGRTVLASTDAGDHFIAHDLPADPAPPPGSGRAAEGTVKRFVCDAAGACVVSIGSSDATDIGRVLQAGAFGPPVAAPPEFEVSSPAPGVVVGLRFLGGGDYKRGPPRWELVRSDDLGVTPYRPAAEWYGGRMALDADGVLSSATPDGVLRSVDGGATFGVPGVPGDPSGGAFVATAGGPVGLGADGGLWRLVGGAWTPAGRIPAPESSPALVDAGKDGVLVVGARRIHRLTPEGRVEELRHPAAGRSRAALRVDGRGGTVLLRGSRADGSRPFAYRSADGGRSWTAIRGRAAALLAAAGPVRFLDGRVGVALRGDTLVRTTDGGRSFRPVAAVPVLDATEEFGPDDEPLERGSFDLSFSDRLHGLVMTTSGLLRTDDGGRRWTPLPAPRDETPTKAVLRSGRLVLQTDAADGAWRTVLRRWHRPPTLVVDRVRRRPAAGRRVFRASGSLRGGLPHDHVVLTAVGADGRTTPLRRVPAARGRFSANVRVPPHTRGIRAWHLGTVRSGGTTPGASSPVARLP